MKIDHICTGSSILIALAGVKGDNCGSGREEIDGNWYCQSVQAIRYSNVGSAGSYNRITGMSPDGSCSSTPVDFSGPLTPFDEEVSVHFRGPLHLKQFAAYAPQEPKHSRRRRSSGGQARGHGHMHRRKHNPQDDENGHKDERRQIVSATIDGEVVSWDNNYFGSTLGANPSTVLVTATIDGQVVSWLNDWFGSSSATATSSPPTAVPTAAGQIVNHIAKPSVKTTVPTTTAVSPAPTRSHSEPSPNGSSAKPSKGNSGSHAPGTFERIGYYDASSQTVDNLAFLGNYGGQGSGVFDYNFGASLSYTDCDGTSGASTPQILADKVIPSDAEVVLMLGSDCSDGGCGFVRPGAVAHHGFGGADKVFLLEFSMPMDGSAGFNGDMPAIWMLNAQIPRTLQYGNPECSCWESGCGEFDIAEALQSGSTFLKSTIHANKAAGDSDYFTRPITSTMKLAVVFNSSSSTVHLQVLPDDTDFSEQFSADEIHRMCSTTPEKAVSHFVVS